MISLVFKSVRDGVELSHQGKVVGTFPRTVLGRTGLVGAYTHARDYWGIREIEVDGLDKQDVALLQSATYDEKNVKELHHALAHRSGHRVDSTAGR